MNQFRSHFFHFFLVFSLCIHPVLAQTKKNILKQDQTIKRVIFYLENNQTNQVYELLNNSSVKKNYVYYILLGKAKAQDNLPKKAAEYFAKAALLASSPQQRQAANYHYSKMQQWMKGREEKKIKANRFTIGKQYFNQNQPEKALLVFQNNAESAADPKNILFLLKTANWLRKDKIVKRICSNYEHYAFPAKYQALVKIECAKLMLNLDYPRKSIALLNSVSGVNLEKDIILSKAYISVAQSYRAKNRFQHSRRLQNVSEKFTYFYHQKQDLDFLLMQSISKKGAAFDFSRIQDSTNFIINRATGEGSIRLFGINSPSTLTLSKSQYFNPIHYVDANMLFFKQDFLNLLHDQIDLSFLLIPSELRFMNSNYISPWNTLLWQVATNLKFNDQFAISGFNNNVLVETVPALQNKILMNNTEISVATHPMDYLYLNFAFMAASFTDANRRMGGAGNLIYQLSIDYNVFAKLRYRGYTNSLVNNPYYFSPLALQEADLFLFTKQRLFTQLYLYLEGGVGLQKLKNNQQDPYSNQPVYTANVNIAYNLSRNIKLSAAYSYIQNVFNNLVGPYSQQYFGARINFFLD